MKRAAFCAALAVTAAVCAATFTGCVAVTPKDPASQPDAPASAPAPEPEPAPEQTSAPGSPSVPDNSGEPLLAILTDQAPYEPVPVEVLPVSGLPAEHHGEGHHGAYGARRMAGGGCHTTAHCGTFAWSYGGNVYVSSQDLLSSAFPGDYFLCFPEQDYVEEAFTDLFGYDGVQITYTERLETGDCTVNDYYVFQEGGDGPEVCLLARMYGEVQRIDLDGNGTEELVSTDGWHRAQLVFQWEGLLFEVDAAAALRECWTELDGLGIPLFAWSPEERCLLIKGAVSDGEGLVPAYRALYFDGKDLLLYAAESYE